MSNTLDVRLSIQRPIDQDGYQVKLLVNFVTYDVTDMLAGVPEEHQPFFADWLMRHTSQLSGLYEISGTELLYAPDPRQLLEHHVDMMAYSIGEEITKTLRGQLHEQLRSEAEALYIRPITTYPRPDSVT